MKVLVVGAGFSGATVARELAESGHQVTVIERRNHIAGNAYDYQDTHGIRIHKYGPHLFHTNNETVWNYLSRFTEWLPYRHKVKALLSDHTLVPFPPNKTTKAIVGEENIIDTFYRPYTKKMWGKELEEVAPSILNRVPGRDDDVDEYFPKDQFQGMPKHGYTELIRNMLNHTNIKVKLGVYFLQKMEDDYDHVFNSMPIDLYYDVQFGTLNYRSIKFHNVVVPVPRMNDVATVNFTHDGPYTRMTEWKNIPGHGDHKYITVVTYEEPCDYTDNNYERYYPVNDEVNKARYEQYKNIPNEKVTFIGRTGLYVYIDMDQAVNSALTRARKFIEQNG